MFYPLGGGQAGDSGVLVLATAANWRSPTPARARMQRAGPRRRSATCRRRARKRCWRRLKPGDTVTARVDWERRHRLMRFHTTTHLLCHLVPQLVNGCSITPDYARLDFNMTDPLDKEALTQGIARLVAAGLPVAVGSITDDELDANPALVKSMSVQPPRGTGRIRTIRIGEPSAADRFPALRRHPCGQHRRDRRGGRHQDREEKRHHPARGPGLCLTWVRNFRPTAELPHDHDLRPPLWPLWP